MKPGRPSNPLRKAIGDRYGLSLRQRKRLTAQKLKQLSACRDESMIRILLGVKEAA